MALTGGCSGVIESTDGSLQQEATSKCHFCVIKFFLVAMIRFNLPLASFFFLISYRFGHFYLYRFFSDLKNIF